MNIKSVTDPNTPIGEILDAADSEGVLLESESRTRFAVLPLDDDLLDYLIEQNPRFIEACRRIREEMHAGRSHTHAEVKRMFANEPASGD